MPILSPFTAPTRNAFCALLMGTVFAVSSAFGAATIHVPADQASLQVALNTVPEGGIIEISAGTYNAPSGGFTIYPDLSGGTRGFTVRAASGASVVLSGGGSSEILVFTTPKLVTFQGLTFANGVSTTQFHGGAVSVSGVQANFVSCTFQNNAAKDRFTGGGAVWIDTSTVSFQSCTWTNNTAPTYAGALSAYRSRVFIRDNTFTGNRTNIPNHTSFSAAGAIHGNSSTMFINNSRFENNQAGYVGGAIYVIGQWADSLMDLVVSDCLFTGNVAVTDPSGAAPPGPNTGGAVMMEDQTRTRFYNCRFTNNTARQGGALSSYRTNTEVQGCVFRNNQAIGTDGADGFGGAIVVLSDDNVDASTAGGTINRPSAKLTVTDSLIHGPGGGVTSARQGGGIFVAGDLHANDGVGVPQNGTPDTNRATVSLKRVVFSDLASSDGGNGTGGAMTADFVALTADNCLVQNCRTSHYGGGFEIIRRSKINITATQFVGNQGGVLGGGLTMFGGELNVSGSTFADNRLTAPGGGSAIFTGPDTGSTPGTDMTGAIQNCVITGNIGGAVIYDGYRASAPFNRLQFNANQIFASDPSPFFFDAPIGYQTIAQVNAMILTFSDNSTCVKATVPNIVMGSSVSTGAVLLVPPQIRSSGAPGETLPLPAFVAFTSSGAVNPSLDGSAQSAKAGVVTTSSDAQHTLTVGGTQFKTTPLPAAALNISTRLPVGQADSALIGGFIIVGPTPKRVIIRGVGPSLTSVAGALQDPILELHDATGATIATNDNWRTTQIGGALTSNQAVDILATTIPPSNDAESAIVATLDPGNYTAILRGTSGTTGIAVVEVYDLDPVQNSTLANISTRGFIQTGDNVMIGGFIYLGGPGATKVVARGIGPSLAAAGIKNPLNDPTLELVDGNGRTVTSNDDANQSPDAGAIQAAGLLPTNAAESAIYGAGLARGAYTVILRGKNGGTGVGLIEVYVFQ